MLFSPGALDRWKQQPGWRQILTIWLATVGYIFCIGWLGTTLLPPLIGWSSGIPDQVASAPSGLMTMFVRWDAGYYLTIAEQGYTGTGTERAFFPLYPLLVRVLSEFTGTPLLWNGLFVSITAYGGAVLLFYHWVRHDHGHATALLAATLLCVSPVSFYFVAFYAEPLLLLTSIASLYLARRGNFVLAGLMIALAGATRPVAFLLGTAYVAELVLHRPTTLAAWGRALFGAGLAPLGALAYYSFLGSDQGIFAGLHTYNRLLDLEWDTRMAPPWELVVNAIKAVVLKADISPDWFSRTFTLHDLLVSLAALIVSLWVGRSLRPSVAIFLFASLLYVFVLHGPGGYAFDSAPRRIAVIVPIHLALALWINQVFPKQRWMLISGMVVWLGVLTAWFTTGRWVS